jgi:hypothetical protein
MPGFCAQPACPASYACTGVQTIAETPAVATSVLLNLICFLTGFYLIADDFDAPSQHLI